jgi:hypothetical protein
MRHAARVEASVELIDLCQQVGVRPVLLKGVSLSEQCYAAGHLRPMTDIDVLIPSTDYDLIERRMLGAGYTRRPGSHRDPNGYHGAPLLLAERGVWVELHIGLFPENSSLRSDGLFGREQLSTALVSSTFRGRAVQRLCDEMQLVYCACAWVRDMRMQHMHPSFLPPLFDAIHLLHAARSPIDWDRLLTTMDNQMACASLYVLLTYLERHDLSTAPQWVFARLAGLQRLVTRSELNTLHRLLDRGLLSGTEKTPLFESWHLWANFMEHGTPSRKWLRLPWRVVFPPSVADRYRLSYQIPRFTRRLHTLRQTARLS